jgi:hypothetical protein
MAITRRTLLIDGTIFLTAGRLASASRLSAEEFPPVQLAFPNVELDADKPLVVGANTSGYNTCHVQVLDSKGKKIVWQSKEWATEPNRSNSAATEKLGGSRSDEKYFVQAIMRPTRPGTPSMAVALHQGTDLTKTQMEQLAEKARFVRDPAQYPEGGHFELNLYLDSTVTVQIWTGTLATGRPVLENQFHNVQAGSNRVPWDLKLKGGKVAPSGRYIALLTCTPNQTGRAPTFLGSSFGVA